MTNNFTRQDWDYLYSLLLKEQGMALADENIALACYLYELRMKVWAEGNNDN